MPVERVCSKLVYQHLHPDDHTRRTHISLLVTYSYAHSTVMPDLYRIIVIKIFPNASYEDGINKAYFCSFLSHLALLSRRTTSLGHVLGATTRSMVQNCH